MMSRPTDFMNDSFVSYQDLSEYIGLKSISDEGFMLNKHLKSTTKP